MTEPVTQRRVETNGISLNIAEQGQGPLVILCHGFPESWYSWRHQLKALAQAGFHAVAPDMRGYGKSDKPHAVEAYNQMEVAADIIGLISALGHKTAAVIGHDWGAPTAWLCAQMYPQLITAVGALSNPFSARSPSPPMAIMEKVFEGQFFYQLYYQTQGVAEAEWEADIKGNLRKFYHLGSGAFEAGEFLKPTAPAPDFFSSVAEPAPDALADWMSEADLNFLAQEFRASGFRGPLNYYRNMDLSWELTVGVPDKVTQPALFVAGDREAVLHLMKASYERMPNYVPDLRVNQLLPNVGHWTPEEAPEQVNKLIIGFLNDVL